MLRKWLTGLNNLTVWIEHSGVVVCFWSAHRHFRLRWLNLRGYIWHSRCRWATRRLDSVRTLVLWARISRSDWSNWFSSWYWCGFLERLFAGMSFIRRVISIIGNRSIAYNRWSYGWSWASIRRLINRLDLLISLIHLLLWSLLLLLMGRDRVNILRSWSTRLVLHGRLLLLMLLLLLVSLHSWLLTASLIVGATNSSDSLNLKGKLRDLDSTVHNTFVSMIKTITKGCNLQRRVLARHIKVLNVANS